MNIVSVTDFRNNISTYLNNIFYNKDSLLIKKGKRVIAEVKYYDEKDKIERRNKLLMSLADAWDDESFKAFKKYKRLSEKKDKEDMKKLIKTFKKLK